MAQRLRRSYYPSRQCLTAAEISSWARFLRDDRMFEDVEALLLVKPEVAADLQVFLFRLDRTEVTRSLLEHTRVHFALEKIISEEHHWSGRIKTQAEATLKGWRTMFGDLTLISPDPWAPGNQLEGIFKLKPGYRYEKPGKSQARDTWVVQGAPDAEKALVCGHNGFHVGQWWINAAAAFRDRIILAFNGVTTGPSSATAVVMCANQEKSSSTGIRLKYMPSPFDPCSLGLLRNLTDKKPVRVLRSYDLQSCFSPRAGLRYDGLYIVKGYCLDFSLEDSERERLQYVFDMEREFEQPSLAQALEHPNAAERDLWDQYERYKDLHEVEASAVIKNEAGTAVIWGSRDESIATGKRDSGYLTG